MNRKTRERRQSRDGAGGGTEIPDSRPSGNTTRTSGSVAHVCDVCGKAITGGRRNGFCSDRCRMRARRAAKQARVEHELAKIESAAENVSPDMTDSAAENVRDEISRAVDSLRGELRSGDGHLSE